MRIQICNSKMFSDYICRCLADIAVAKIQHTENTLGFILICIVEKQMNEVCILHLLRKCLNSCVLWMETLAVMYETEKYLILS